MKKIITILSSPFIPLYGAFLSVLVLSFITDPSTLLPILSILFLIILTSLFLGDLKKTIVRHFMLGAFSCALILIGKFDYVAHWFVTVGMFGLFFAAFLNLFGNSD